jgi:hypothetical protein
MADPSEHQNDDLDVVVRAAQAALEAALERKRAEKEAEEKRKAIEAETKCKAEEAKVKRKAKEAERKEAEAKEVAEKKKVEKAEAERAEKARTAQAIYEVGVQVVQADQRNSAEQTARINAQVVVTKRRNLGRLGIGPNDPLLQTPVVPGLSNPEVRKIRKGLVHQPKKRKLGEDDDSVVLADATEYAAGIAVSFHLFDVGSADLELQAGKCEHCAHRQEECMPSSGRACATCNS